MDGAPVTVSFSCMVLGPTWPTLMAGTYAVWNIYRYASETVIRIVTNQNQKWYAYQKKW